MVRLTNFILDCLFPRACVSCQQKGSLLCSTCQPTALGESPVWTPEHVSFAWYARRPVNQLLDAWKFQGDLSVESFFKNHILDFQFALFKHWSWLKTGEAVLVPAPLTKRRHAERGFNQAERLANILGQVFNLRVQKLFVRTGPNIHLATLEGEVSRSQALATQNIAVVGPLPTRVIIVDDVKTTGVTLAKLRDTLRAQGVTEIYTVTFAQSQH